MPEDGQHLIEFLIGHDAFPPQEPKRFNGILPLRLGPVRPQKAPQGYWVCLFDLECSAVIELSFREVLTAFITRSNSKEGSKVLRVQRKDVVVSIRCLCVLLSLEEDVGQVQREFQVVWRKVDGFLE